MSITPTGIPGYEHNYLSSQNRDFESGVGDWTGGFGTGTIAWSVEKVHSGTHSGKVTWTPGGAQGASSIVAVDTGLSLVNGETYTVTGWVYVPTGMPRVRIGMYFLADGSNSTKFDQWELLSCTFTYNGGTQQPSFSNFDTAQATDYCYIDDVQISRMGRATVTRNPDVPPRWIVSPPTRESYERDASNDLLRYYSTTEGVTYYKVGGTWYHDNYLSADTVADELYRGGYEYTITDAAKANELIALGFSWRQEPNL